MYFGFSFDNQYFVFNSLCFGYKAAPDYFQAFSQDLVRICREQGILCKVELDDFLIYADSSESCLNSVNFVIAAEGSLLIYRGACLRNFC